MPYRETDLLPLSGVQNFVFCPRQWALINVEQAWEENYLTVSGSLFHDRVHDVKQRELRDGILTLRGIAVVSWELGFPENVMLWSFIRMMMEFLWHMRKVYGNRIPWSINVGNRSSIGRTKHSFVRRQWLLKRCYAVRYRKEPCFTGSRIGEPPWCLTRDSGN